MKKCFFTVLIALAALTANAQSRGIKIAYIDMNYILDKVPDYAEAKNQLEQKATKWKQELEVKRNDISKLKESLQQEKALLTKELIEEREEEIAYQEKELLDYQEKRFGPTGDLIAQKSVLIKPIQDQVFTIAQDLAALRNYDFVFDKSSDLTMIVAAKKHDISDHIINRMLRASKQEKLSSKEIKKLEEQEAKEELESNPDYAERQKVLEDRKTAKEKKLEERKAIQDEKKRAYEEKREQMKQKREAKKSGTTAPTTATPAGTEAAPADTKAKTTTKSAPKENTATQGETNTDAKTAAQSTEGTGEKTAAQIAKEDREKKIEEKKKALEEKKKKILEDREAAKKAREEKLKNQGTNNTSTPAEGTEETPAKPSN